MGWPSTRACQFRSYTFRIRTMDGAGASTEILADWAPRSMYTAVPPAPGEPPPGPGSPGSRSNMTDLDGSKSDLLTASSARSEVVTDQAVRRDARSWGPGRRYATHGPSP